MPLHVHTLFARFSGSLKAHKPQMSAIFIRLKLPSVLLRYIFKMIH